MDEAAMGGRGVTELRAERDVLASLAAEVAGGVARVPDGSSLTWRSRAQREYAARLDELRGVLTGAAARLRDAVDRLDARLARGERGG